MKLFYFSKTIFTYIINNNFNYFPKLNVIIFVSILIIYIYVYKIIKDNNIKLKREYSKFQFDLNYKFNNNNINKIIRIAIYTVSLSDGGLQRITSKLINFLEKIKIFRIYLFNQKDKEENEYKISDNINRVVIKKLKDPKYLIKQLIKKKIDIFIYQFPILKEINALNKLKDIKVIFYLHSGFFYWFYSKYYPVLNIYKE